MNWTQLIQGIQDLKDIESDDKERILNGWRVLEDILGPDWLEDAVSTNHPWITEFKNGALWVKSGFGIIGERLSELKGTKGFEDVVERLKKPNLAVSALAEINAAWKLHKDGLDFEFREPSQKNKEADIKAYIDGESISVEVSVPQKADSYRIQKNNYTRLSLALIHPEVSSGMIVYNSLSHLWTENLISRINESIKKAREKQQVVEFREFDVAEFCIAPIELKSRVDEWKKKRDIEPNSNLRADKLDSNLGRRIHRIIQDKCKQFEANRPGIVYLEGIPFSTWFGNRPAPWDFHRADIEMAVTENTDLLFVAIGGLGAGHGPSVHNVDYQKRNYVSSCRLLPELYEETWVLTNPFHKWSSMDNSDIINAFWRVGDSISHDEWMAEAAKSIQQQFEKLDE